MYSAHILVTNKDNSLSVINSGLNKVDDQVSNTIHWIWSASKSEEKMVIMAKEKPAIAPTVTKMAAMQVSLKCVNSSCCCQL